eukprot:scaffold109965_cov28-Tisochrysis_lutea.AAC.5
MRGSTRQQQLQPCTCLLQLAMHAGFTDHGVPGGGGGGGAVGVQGGSAFFMTESALAATRPGVGDGTRAGVTGIAADGTGAVPAAAERAVARASNASRSASSAAAASASASAVASSSAPPVIRAEMLEDSQPEKEAFLFGDGGGGGEARRGGGGRRVASDADGSADDSECSTEDGNIPRASRPNRMPMKAVHPSTRSACPSSLASRHSAAAASLAGNRA